MKHPIIFIKIYSYPMMLGLFVFTYFINTNLIQSQELFQNGGLSVGVTSDCNVPAGIGGSCMTFGGQCIPPWKRCFGTPQLGNEGCKLSSDPHTELTENFILSIANHEGSEGFYQDHITLIPGDKYILSFRVWTTKINGADLGDGQVRVSLYKGGSAILGGCQDPPPNQNTRIEVFNQSSDNFLDQWWSVSMEYCAQNGDENFNSVLFWSYNNGLTGDEHVLTKFDCFSLVHAGCSGTWDITTPGFNITGENYWGIIHIHSSDPLGAQISTYPYENILMRANRYILIEPGFISMPDSHGSALLDIGPCECHDGIHIVPSGDNNLLRDLGGEIPVLCCSLPIPAVANEHGNQDSGNYVEDYETIKKFNKSGFIDSLASIVHLYQQSIIIYPDIISENEAIILNSEIEGNQKILQIYISNVLKGVTHTINSKELNIENGILSISLPDYKLSQGGYLLTIVTNVSVYTGRFTIIGN